MWSSPTIGVMAFGCVVWGWVCLYFLYMYLWFHLAKPNHYSTPIIQNSLIFQSSHNFLQLINFHEVRQFLCHE